jgi:cyclopropane fatty-acyl-phospholipid synthase-like methyltransferase
MTRYPGREENSMSKTLSDFITYTDPKLERKYAKKRIPINELLEAYIEKKVDFHGDVYEMLSHRADLTDEGFSTALKSQLSFIVNRLLPEVVLHTQHQDKRIVREHYNRGNDFFGFFLGPRMVYTSGFYLDGDDSLEKAQDQKMQLICEKLLLEPTDRYMDIGSGWGTLVMHAAREFGADATGITISEEQAQFSSDRIETAGLADKARINVMDYRDIPKEKFNKISCVEMAEHVGSKNFRTYMHQLYDLLEDDGLLYLQMAGPKVDGRKENLGFGLFMAKYIFPGADAARKLTWITDHLEAAGFEVHSVENVGIHYSVTLKQWYDNWLSNEEAVLEAYGEWWFRLWSFFLAWASLVAKEGQSTCFQILCNKNTRSLDRKMFFGSRGLGERTENTTLGQAHDKAEAAR